MRVLGATCTPKTAFLSVVEDGEVVDASVQKVDVAALHEASAELEATLDELGRTLSELHPDHVVVLMPEQSRFKKTYTEIAPRVALETLLRIAAVRAGISVDVMPRPTVRARLKLPRTGELASHVSAVFDKPTGKHWTAGRDVAALAARAGEVAQ